MAWIVYGTRDTVFMPLMVGVVGFLVLFSLVQLVFRYPRLVLRNDGVEICNPGESKTIPWSGCKEFFVWRPVFVPLVAISFTDSYRKTIGKPFSREGIDAIVMAVFPESAEKVCAALEEWRAKYSGMPNNAMHATCEDARA